MLTFYSIITPLVFLTSKVLTPHHFTTFFPQLSIFIAHFILLWFLPTQALDVIFVSFIFYIQFVENLSWIVPYYGSPNPGYITSGLLDPFQKLPSNFSIMHVFLKKEKIPPPKSMTLLCGLSPDFSSFPPTRLGYHHPWHLYDTRTSLRILFIYFLLWLSQLCEVVRN